MGQITQDRKKKQKTIPPPLARAIALISTGLVNGQHPMTLARM